MLKDRVKQALKDITPTEDSNIQLIYTAAEIMVEEVLPDIHDMLNASPYFQLGLGETVCVFCKKPVQEHHTEDCPYERLKLKARFFHQQFHNG